APAQPAGRRSSGDLRSQGGYRPAGRSASSGSHVELELHDVAVSHYVLLALLADLAVVTGLGHGAVLVQVGEADDLGLDEAALDVGVDDTGGLRGGRTLRDRPGAGLLRAGRQVGLQAEGGETSLRQGLQAR